MELTSKSSVSGKRPVFETLRTSAVVCASLLTVHLCVLSPQALLDAAVTKSEGFSVEQLERLYCLLSQCVYKHRREYDKTRLLEVSDALPALPTCTRMHWGTRLFPPPPPNR